MVSLLETFSKMDMSSFIITMVVLALIIKGFIELIDWAVNRTGLQTKWGREKKKMWKMLNDHEARLKDADNAVLLEKIDDISNRLLEIEKSCKKFESKMTKYDAQFKNLNETMQSQLYDRLEQKTIYYRDVLGGIPADERAGYKLLLEQYKKLGGNHGMDVKVQDCLDNLPKLASSAILTPTPADDTK